MVEEVQFKESANNRDDARPVDTQWMTDNVHALFEANRATTQKQAEPDFLVFADAKSEGKGGIHQEANGGEVRTAKQLADSITDAKNAAGSTQQLRPADAAAIQKSLIPSIQNAYEGGGIIAANNFIKAVNENIVGPYGPQLKFDGEGKATLRLVEQDPKNLKNRWAIANDVQFQLDKEVAPTTDANIRSGKAKVENAAPLASAYGAVKALDMLQKSLSGEITSINGNQDQLLDLKAKLSGDLKNVPKEILDGMASANVDDLNDFLKDKGYDIKLRPLGRGGVGVVTSTEIEGKWAGKNAPPITSEGKEYAAFKLKTSEIYEVNGNTVAKIFHDKESGIKVFVAPYAGKVSGLDAGDIANGMTPKAGASRSTDYNAVVLPKVDLNQKVQLKWLEGMNIGSGNKVDQALAQAKVQMDENGFKAKEGLAVSTSRGIERDEALKFDKPFMFWVQKDGLQHPLFAAKIEQKDWKTPPKN